MKNCDYISRLHPMVNFLYFTFVLFFAMFLMHPVCLLISFFSALIYAWRLRGTKKVLHTMAYMSFIMFITILINAAFSHTGTTVLAYLPSGNPLTLESILYGTAASVMLGSVILWFSCVNAVLTTDKFICLFGGLIPALALLLSMIFRFIPRFTRQFHQVRKAQTAMGKAPEEGSLLVRLRNFAGIVSVMITWSLENAISTADSMKSRGYGLPGRTAFSVYRFTGRDTFVLFWLIVSGIGMFAAWHCGAFAWTYYPNLSGNGNPLFLIPASALYASMCVTPLFLNVLEWKKWKLSEFKN